MRRIFAAQMRRMHKLFLLSSKLMNKMRWNKLFLLFLDGLPKLARYLFCYENHSNGHFSKMGRLHANELTVWAPMQWSNVLAWFILLWRFFPILFYQNKPRVDFGGILTLDWLYIHTSFFRCSPRGFSATCLQQIQGSVVEGLSQTATSGSQCFFVWDIKLSLLLSLSFSGDF